MAPMTAVEFDFGTRQERTIPVGSVTDACARGKYCWVDLDLAADPEAAEGLLRGLGIEARAIDEALAPEGVSRYDVYGDCFSFAVTAGRFEDGRLVTSRVDALIAESLFVTVRRGDVEFLRQVRRTYPQDFVKFAKSPSFLLYEFWDHLIESYRRAGRTLADLVRQVQDRIFGETDDTIFSRVAGLSRDLLALRKLVLEAREVLDELTTRRFPFVAESTLPFLEKMVGALERVAADLAVGRESLAETLNLYMGIVSHRTNRVLNRLTVISLVFLPLTFLCGVYGMNFEVFPEVRWKYGYLFFWAITLLIVSASVAYIRAKKWL
jgi:magnesium transporter